MQKLPTRIAHNEAVCQCHDLMRCEGGQLAWLNLRARGICTQGFIILCLFWRPSFYIAQVQVLLGAGRLFRFDPLRLRCLVVKGFCLSCLKSSRPQHRSNHVTYGSHSFREGCVGRLRDLKISRNLSLILLLQNPNF